MVATRKTEVLGDVEAFTPAPMNRPLQAAFLAFFLVPQLIIFSMAEDYTAYEEVADLFRPALRLSSWQRWLQDEAFILVLICLSIERMVYSVVWLFPAHFVHFAQHSPLRRFGQGRPLDVVVSLFYISKVFQLGSIFGHYFYIGSVESLLSELRGLTAFRLVLGVQFFVVGQLLNASIYRAIGKAGVYYGYKIGVPVPWCTGFPFNVFTMHPQYAGVVMSVLGGGLLMCTKEHAKLGFVGVGISQALYYLYMAIVEDIPAEHPRDKLGLGVGVERDPIRLRDLRKLKWSGTKSKEFHTTSNVLGLMARPWFQLVLAGLAVANSFLMVLPVNLLFLFICYRHSYSVLPAAFTYAFGLSMGVALLAWAVESSCPTGCPGVDDSIVGIAMTAGAIREHWPIALSLVRTGKFSAPLLGNKIVVGGRLSGAFAALCANHPLPVVLAYHGSGSAVPMIVIAFFASFITYSLMGLAAVAVHSVLVALYRHVYADFEPEGTEPAEPPATAAKAAATPKRAAKSPSRAAAASPARAKSPRRTPAKKTK